VMIDPSTPWHTAFVLDAPAVSALAGTTALFLRGQHQRALHGRARPERTAAFLGGVAVVLVALLSPVAAYSEVLLWAHMVQHLLLVVVAAPLLALAAPVTTIRLALPPGARHALARTQRASRRARRRLGDPHPVLLAAGVHVAITWSWHAPVLYDLAVANAGVHLLEHAAFLASAVWLWSEVVATARKDRTSQALATLALGAVMVTGGVLGALLVFADRSLYGVYDGFGPFAAIEDQELAGALMWVLPSFVYAVVAIRRFIAWFEATDVELRRREQRDRARERRANADLDDAAASVTDSVAGP
jgi:putative membrane protein